MACFKSILLPADFSRASLGAEQYGAFLARHFRAELTLLNVLPVVPILKLLMGDPAKAICSHVDEAAPDLLVIGRGTARRAFGRLRSQTYEIIHQSGCPVVSI